MTHTHTHPENMIFNITLFGNNIVILNLSHRHVLLGKSKEEIILMQLEYYYHKKRVTK